MLIWYAKSLSPPLRPTRSSSAVRCTAVWLRLGVSEHPSRAAGAAAGGALASLREAGAGAAGRRRGGHPKDHGSGRIYGICRRLAGTARAVKATRGLTFKPTLSGVFRGGRGRRFRGLRKRERR